MKFKVNGLVWDKERDKLLCQGVDGIVDTEDNEVVNKLIDLGYECSEEKVVEKPIEKKAKK
jgi:hypothetical protein